MIGYHAVPVIVDAYQKGSRGFDIEKAYQAIVKSAHYSEENILYPSADVREKLNPKAKQYNDTLGFIPCDLENESVSKALEYAYNDWCIAQLAKVPRQGEGRPGVLGEVSSLSAVLRLRDGFHARSQPRSLLEDPFQPPVLTASQG